MANKKLLLITFCVVALIQLYVPAKMIFDSEDVLTTGKEFKFKTEPIDPNDPFRGKYITLRFEENHMEQLIDTNWVANQDIYVELIRDVDGYAKIKTISKTEPSNTEDYVKSKVNYYSQFNEKVVYIDYPFERYYMEETKAPDAEIAYRESARDTSQNTYALVSIKKGQAVLKDVFINETSIKTIVAQQQASEK